MGIVTVAGKLADAEDELSATLAPGANAAAVSVAVQLEPPGGVTEAGLQERARHPTGRKTKQTVRFSKSRFDKWLDIAFESFEGCDRVHA